MSNVLKIKKMKNQIKYIEHLHYFFDLIVEENAVEGYDVLHIQFSY